MFRFVRDLLRAAVSDAVDRMGTTGLAVAVSLAPWLLSLVRNLSLGGIPALTSNWTAGLVYTGCIWLFLLAWCLQRQFRPVLREHRRVFRMIAFNQDQHTDPHRVLIWCLLQFSKDFGPADFVVRVTTFLPGRDPVKSVVHSNRLIKVSKDECKRLQLGSLRILSSGSPPYHSIWGSDVGTEDLKQGQVTIMTDTSHLIEISFGPQTYRCYVEFVASPRGALSAPMFMTNEDRSPWLLELPSGA
jgi:hypothetical protein